jgi:hypothetical protein
MPEQLKTVGLDQDADVVAIVPNEGKQFVGEIYLYTGISELVVFTPEHYFTFKLVKVEVNKSLEV